MGRVPVGSKVDRASLDPFLSTDTLETCIESFSNMLRSAKIAVHEAIKHFPDLRDIIAEKRQIRKQWQRYRNRVDKVELNRLTNFIKDQISEFCLKKIEDVQKVRDSVSFWKLAN